MILFDVSDIFSYKFEFNVYILVVKLSDIVLIKLQVKIKLLFILIEVPDKLLNSSYVILFIFPDMLTLPDM